MDCRREAGIRGIARVLQASMHLSGQATLEAEDDRLGDIHQPSQVPDAAVQSIAERGSSRSAASRAIQGSGCRWVRAAWATATAARGVSGRAVTHAAIRRRRCQRGNAANPRGRSVGIGRLGRPIWTGPAVGTRGLSLAPILVVGGELAPAVVTQRVAQTAVTKAVDYARHSGQRQFGREAARGRLAGPNFFGRFGIWPRLNRLGDD